VCPAPYHSPVPRRRTIIKAVILLIAGAALNVAVAWGCVFAWPLSRQRFMEPRNPTIEEFQWIQRQGEHPSAIFGGMGGGSTGIGIEERRWVLRDPNYEAAAQQRYSYSAPPYSADRIHAGWPKLAMEGHEVRHTNAFSTVHPNRPAVESTIRFGKQFMPSIPLWPGFAINTLFYAGVLWVLFAGPFALRRMIRRRRGQCAHCAYPIGQSPVCTECGAAVIPKASRDQGIEASRE